MVFSGTKNIPPWVPALLFVVLALLIGAIGYAAFQANKKSLMESGLNELRGVADLKVAQIGGWYEIQKKWGESFAHLSRLPNAFDRWIAAGAPDGAARQSVLEMVANYQRAQGYVNFALLDRNGISKAMLREGAPLNAEQKKLALQAMDTQQVLLSEFFKDANGDIRIDLAVPMLVGDGQKRRVAGLVLFQFDPHAYLYPVIQSWPTGRKTAETLLVRRDGDDMLFLNDLRFMKGAALTLRMPVTTPGLVSVHAVSGKKKLVDGMDYRGVPVMAALHGVPETSWFVVSKIDKSEMFAPIDMIAGWALGLAATFIAGTGLLLVILFKSYRVRCRYITALDDATNERDTVAQRYEHVNKFASDIMLLLDSSGRIVEANDKAVRAYGYSIDELVTMSIHDLLPVGEKARLAEVEKSGQLKFEAVHVRKDGSEFPVDCKMQSVAIGCHRYFQGIVRDSSERKRAEEVVRDSEMRLRAAQRIAHFGNWELDLTDYSLYWSDEIYRIFEINPAVFGASYQAFIELVHPDDRDKLDAVYRDSVKNKTAYSITHRLLFPDGRIKYVQAWCETYYDEEGNPLRSVGTAQDVTERQVAEEARWRERNFVLQVIDTDPNLIFVKDPDGKFLLVNQAMATLHGKTAREMIGMDGSQLFQSREEAEPHLRADSEAMASGQTVKFTARCFLGGKYRWLCVTKVPMKQGDGTVNVLGIAVDITEPKLAEEKLADSYRELEKLTTHLEVVREDEQKRIARELHDEMGSVLAALNINTALLAEKLPSEMTELREDVQCLVELVEAGIKAMRQTVSALRPSLLDELGLRFALEKYIQEFQHNTGIECDLRLPDADPAVNANEAAVIFRIVQESLTNVAKYAKASRVNVVLSDWETSVMLTIKDNGKGFDSQVRKANSFGLLGIRERAAMVGGKAEISSEPGKGTMVRFSLMPASSLNVRDEDVAPGQQPG